MYEYILHLSLHAVDSCTKPIQFSPNVYLLRVLVFVFILYHYRKMVFVLMKGQIAWGIFSLISLRPGIQDVFHNARMRSLRQGAATNRVRVRSVVTEEVVVWSALMNDRSAAGEIGTC